MSGDQGFSHLRDELLVEGHVISVFRSTFRGPDGEEFDREVVRHPGAVSVVPLTDDGEVVLVRQYRAPLDRFLLEIPAGKRDVEGEPPEETARRELAEEVGLVPTELVPLAVFHNSVGFCDEESDACMLEDVSQDVCPEVADAQCVTNVCNPTTSMCEIMPVPDGTPCDDFLFCSGADVCMAGVCTASTVDPCPGPDGDTNCKESCDEESDSCTAFDPAGTVCRPGSGDVCDPTETCNGSAKTCPSDVVSPAGTTCRVGSGDSCDLNETCTGVAGAPCPPNDAPGKAGQLCRAGSGDSCDLNETCTGTPGAPCPPQTSMW